MYSGGSRLSFSFPLGLDDVTNGKHSVCRNHDEQVYRWRDHVGLQDINERTNEPRKERDREREREREREEGRNRVTEGERWCHPLYPRFSRQGRNYYRNKLSGAQLQDVFHLARMKITTRFSKTSFRSRETHKNLFPYVCYWTRGYGKRDPVLNTSFFLCSKLCKSIIIIGVIITTEEWKRVECTIPRSRVTFRYSDEYLGACWKKAWISHLLEL